MKKFMLLLLLLFAGQALAQNDSYLHLNKMIAKLEKNLVVTGIWVSALHPSNAIGIIESNGFPGPEEALTRPMIDFILIDMEHQPYDIVGLRNFLLALNSKREVAIKGNLQPNLVTLVRIPGEGDQPVHAMIKQVLDVGVHGVVVPHVRSARQAEKIVSACRYPQPGDSAYPTPAGTRGASPWLASYLWGLSLKEYVARADLWPLNPEGDLLAVIMIEDAEGVANLEDILKVKGIGAVIFGPYDYSFSCGHPGETAHPQVLQAWDKVKRICDRNDVPLIGFATPANIGEKLAENYRILLIGHDVRNNGSIPEILDAIAKEKLQK